MRATLRTNSAEETTCLGREIGKRVAGGDVIALYGELGSGKTTITCGIADGLKVKHPVHSPTFTIIHEHPGPLTLYHIDLYRLETEYDLETIGLEDYLWSDGVAVIEWAERAEAALPGHSLRVSLRTIDDDSREIVLEAECDRLMCVVKEIASIASSCH